MRWRLAGARQHGDRAQARELRRQARALPSTDPMDPGYRRLFYCRYAAYADSGIMPTGM